MSQASRSHERPRLRVLLLQPYHSGSHASWLSGYIATSAHDIVGLTMPGRFWKWRMHGAAVTFARRVRTELGDWRPDVVMATEMLDVAAFLGLARDVMHGVPVAVYVHEHQLAYPAPKPDPTWTPSRRRRAARHDEHYPWINTTSFLAADLVLWSSEHNRSSYLQALRTLLGRFPDERELVVDEAIASRSEIMPLGLDLRSLDTARPVGRQPGPPRILWNHRWEHDKDPQAFFAALASVADLDLAFEVVVLGESFGQQPPVFTAARQALGQRVLHWGYAASRKEYARWLWQSDVVVSTARHEFFGSSVCEAMYCGCLPLLPRRLSYPDLVPLPYHDEVLYDDQDALVGALTAVLANQSLLEPIENHVQKAALRAAVSEFDWRRMATIYDDRLKRLAAEGPAARQLY